MEEKDKQSKIEELIGQISPLNYERILSETKLYFSEKLPDRNEAEIEELRTKIQELYGKLSPLLIQLRQLQCHYEIEYQGQLSNTDTTTYWNNPERQIFYLQTCCQIDTFANTWGPFIDDPCINTLLTEVYQIIFRQRYSNFRILNIRRI